MQEEIQITLCTDVFSFAGMLVTINSIIKNCSKPQNLHFFIVVETHELKNLTQLAVDKYFQGVHFTLKALTQEEIDKVVSYKEFCKDNIHCKNIMNFSRFLLPIIFSELQYFLYIDTDFLVLDDICKLWSCIDKTNTFYAVPSEYTNENAYALSEGAKRTLQLSKRKPFNAGISVISGEYWRTHAIPQEMIGLMNNPELQKAFRYGTQPLLNYKFQETYTYLPTSWNRIAYDYSNELQNRTIDVINNLTKEEIIHEGISAVHFAGCPKPWVGIHSIGGGNWPSPGDIYKQYFPYSTVLKLNTSIKKYLDLPIIEKCIKEARETFGITIINSSSEEFNTVSNKIQLFCTETTEESNSPYFFVWVKGNIVVNNTILSNEKIFDIMKNERREDGIVIIEHDDIQPKYIFKNLFEELIGQIHSFQEYKHFLDIIVPYIIFLHFLD